MQTRHLRLRIYPFVKNYAEMMAHRNWNSNANWIEKERKWMREKYETVFETITHSEWQLGILSFFKTEYSIVKQQQKMALFFLSFHVPCHALDSIWKWSHSQRKNKNDEDLSIRNHFFSSVCFCVAFQLCVFLQFEHMLHWSNKEKRAPS